MSISTEKKKETKVVQKGQDEKLDEILDLLRSQQRQASQFEEPVVVSKRVAEVSFTIPLDIQESHYDLVSKFATFFHDAFSGEVSYELTKEGLDGGVKFDQPIEEVS